MPRFKIFALPILLFFFFACENRQPATTLEKLADGFCECTNSLAEINREVQNQSPDSTLAAENLERIAAEYENSKNCATTLVGQFGKLKTADFEKIKPYLKKKCPDRADNIDLLRELLGE